MVENKLSACYLTINRNCNIRCSWCYAKDTGFSIKDDMKLEMVDQIIAFCKSSGIGRIVLIGGEPTVYPHIFELLDKLKDFEVSMITNGIALSNEKVLDNYVRHNIKRFSVSIKASNSKEYSELTGVNCFDKVLKAINNISSRNLQLSVSYVLTNDNFSSAIEMLDTVIENGAKRVFFSFCRDVNTLQNKDFISNNNPYEIADKFMNLLPLLKKKCPEVTYAMNLPLCVFPQEFIDENLEDFKAPCYVYGTRIVTFDPKGYLIACNTLLDIKYGQIGVDFKNHNDYEKFIKSEKYLNIKKKICGLPSKKCKECKYLHNCYGRCICNWTNYTYDELKGTIKKQFFQKKDNFYD